MIGSKKNSLHTNCPINSQTPCLKYLNSVLSVCWLRPHVKSLLDHDLPSSKAKVMENGPWTHIIYLFKWWWPKSWQFTRCVCLQNRASPKLTANHLKNYKTCIFGDLYFQTDLNMNESPMFDRPSTDRVPQSPGLDISGGSCTLGAMAILQRPAKWELPTLGLLWPRGSWSKSLEKLGAEGILGRTIMEGLSPNSAN